MRFYTRTHLYYCGVDLHSRSMYLCILTAEGDIVAHRNMSARPEPFLKALAPLSRRCRGRRRMHLYLVLARRSLPA